MIRHTEVISVSYGKLGGNFFLYRPFCIFRRRLYKLTECRIISIQIIFNRVVCRIPGSIERNITVLCPFRRNKEIDSLSVDVLLSSHIAASHSLCNSFSEASVCRSSVPAKETCIGSGSIIQRECFRIHVICSVISTIGVTISKIIGNGVSNRIPLSIEIDHVLIGISHITEVTIRIIIRTTSVRSGIPSVQRVTSIRKSCIISIFCIDTILINDLLYLIISKVGMVTKGIGYRNPCRIEIDVSSCSGCTSRILKHLNIGRINFSYSSFSAVLSFLICIYSSIRLICSAIPAGKFVSGLGRIAQNDISTLNVVRSRVSISVPCSGHVLVRDGIAISSPGCIEIQRINFLACFTLSYCFQSPKILIQGRCKSLIGLAGVITITGSIRISRPIIQDVTSTSKRLIRRLGCNCNISIYCIFLAQIRGLICIKSQAIAAICMVNNAVRLPYRSKCNVIGRNTINQSFRID